MEWTRGCTIGHGSTATVSLATSALTGDVFAAKSAEVSRSEYLQREQEILSSMSCPYIIGYRGCDTTRENNNISMYNIFLEYMPGGTLNDAIRSNGGSLDERAIRNYTWQILQGLDYLHSTGLVHCDIKGRNILLGPSGAKIADFGCAKRVDPEQPSTTTLAGTPMFMAPEVARGEEQGFPSDIWSLGCTIIEMATGVSPWRDLNDPVSVLYRVGYSGEVPDIPCFLSEQARDFLDKCIRRDPKERWTARQLLNHPFLLGDQGKQLEASNASTCSPTSILDQAFWNSLEEPETSTSLSNTTSSGVCPGRDRLRQLVIISGPAGPSWDHDDDWVTVRGRSSGSDDTIMGGIEVREAGVIGQRSSRIALELQEFGGGGSCSCSSSRESLDCNVNGSRNCGGDFYLFGGCTYGKDSFLGSGRNYSISERDRDILLIPSR